MMTKEQTFLIIPIILFLLIAPSAFARIGVGVNLGKIKVDEPLKPGGIYHLPSLGVINTGDEAGDYELEVTYHQDQPELRPKQEWFSFNPSKFELEPGKSQMVEIKLSLPLKAEPGDYFAYLEAHPVVKAEGGGTTIGVAAATKCYFKIVPANLWQAITHRISSFFKAYAPYSFIVLIVIIGAIGFVILRRFFAISFKVTKR